MIGTRRSVAHSLYMEPLFYLAPIARTQLGSIIGATKGRHRVKKSRPDCGKRLAEIAENSPLNSRLIMVWREGFPVCLGAM